MNELTKNAVSQRFVDVVFELIKLRLIQSGADLMQQFDKPPTSWPNIMKGRQSVTLEMLEMLSTRFGVHPKYLLLGTLPMFFHEATQQKGNLSHTAGENQLNPSSTLKILTIPVDFKGNELVSVVPEFALAGYSEFYQDPNFIQELPIETIPDDLQNKGTVRKFQIYGESMEPTFLHGDYVYCTYVEVNNPKDFGQKIRNEYIYVINCARGVFIKRIFYHFGEDFVTCYSDKHKIDGEEKFAPFKVDLRDIHELWYFRRRYTAQAPIPKVQDREFLELKNEVYKTQLAILEIQRKKKKKEKDK